MAIITALITASVALLVPFIAFYLNKAPTVTDGTKHVHIDVPITLSPNARLFIVVPMALIWCVPVGLLAFCVAVVGNIIFAPSQDVFLFSLDAGLCSSANLAVSLVFHAGLNESREWWNTLKWYQPVMLAFSSSLAYVMALIGNSIWALAHGSNPVEVSVFYDSIDAAILGGLSAWLAAYGTMMIEELRTQKPIKESAASEKSPTLISSNSSLS